jgi:hypothetical protein
VDNIKIDLTERGRDGMDWIDLAQDKGAVESPFEHGDAISGSLNYWEVLEWLHN